MMVSFHSKAVIWARGVYIKAGLIPSVFWAWGPLYKHKRKGEREQLNGPEPLAKSLKKAGC